MESKKIKSSTAKTKTKKLTTTKSTTKKSTSTEKKVTKKSTNTKKVEEVESTPVKSNKVKFRIRYNKPVFRVYNHRAVTCFISAEVQTASEVLGKFRTSYRAKAVTNYSDGDEFNEELGKKLSLLRAKIKIQETLRKSFKAMADYMNDQSKILEEDFAYISYDTSKLNDELKNTLSEISDAETK